MSHLTVALGSVRLRWPARYVAWVAGLVVAALLLGSLGLLLGDYPITWPEALSALVGLGDDRLAIFFVQGQRAPRVLAALVVGAALGIAGCIFQSLTGNPLGSPDVIGFSVGAATGAIVQIIVLDAGPVGVAAGAVVGGFVTAALVYALAWRGGLSATRLVLVGIGIGVIAQALNSLLIVRASLSAAQTAQQWLAGSFNATTWGEALPGAVVVVALGGAAIALVRPLVMLTFGDELATGLGVAVEKRRRELVVVGVALVAVAVAVAGPVAFVALSAPQLARRLTGGVVPMAASAAMGAVLVVASDLIAQRAFAPIQLPVGVVTGVLGGLYLIWLLAREWRK